MPRKAKYVLEIEKAIQGVYDRAVEYESVISSEIQTRYSLIDPLLRSLGWDLSNPVQVHLEYATNIGKVDYAFFVPQQDDPIIFLEAKKITEGDIHYTPQVGLPGLDIDEDNWIEWRSDFVTKLRDYCKGINEGFAVLTDGIFWNIYDLQDEGPFENKPKHSFSIGHITVGQSSGKLQLLHRRNVLKKVRHDVHT